VLVLWKTASLPDVSTVAMNSKSAAKSAIGMAEMLAHEIKNPLAGITGAAQLISMNASGEDRELTDLIVEESRRILALLDRSRSSATCARPNGARSTSTTCSTGREIRRHRLCRAYGHRGRLRPVAAADLGRSRPVHAGLPEPAEERGGGGRVGRHDPHPHLLRPLSLKVRRRDGTGGAVPLQVEIMDDGPGIPPEIAADIFEPFVSGRENGTGLGLALISKIISDHDGWIAVDSAPDAPFSAFPCPSRRARSAHDPARARPDDRSILTWTVPFSSPTTTARSAPF
jgi:two-component system nitrogen regulation sensor histidine kinase GlnL